MKIILGSKDQYYSQTNNAQVDLMRDYFQKRKYIACGPTSFVAGLDIAGWEMSIFTPGVQPEDSVIMLMHNPAHLGYWQSIRDLDYDKHPPNEIPQLYPGVAKILYKRDDVCKFSFGLTMAHIKNLIENGCPVMVHGKFSFGNHYVLIVGYDNDNLIYNDPYPYGYPDKKGYNRIMTPDFLDEQIDDFKIDFYRANK